MKARRIHEKIKNLSKDPHNYYSMLQVIAVSLIRHAKKKKDENYFKDWVNKSSVFQMISAQNTKSNEKFLEVKKNFQKVKYKTYFCVLWKRKILSFLTYMQKFLRGKEILMQNNEGEL